MQSSLQENHITKPMQKQLPDVVNILNVEQEGGRARAQDCLCKENIKKLLAPAQADNASRQVLHKSEVNFTQVAYVCKNVFSMYSVSSSAFLINLLY